jgi:hypothetical protein
LRQLVSTIQKFLRRLALSDSVGRGVLYLKIHGIGSGPSLPIGRIAWLASAHPRNFRRPRNLRHWPALQPDYGLGFIDGC